MAGNMNFGMSINLMVNSNNAQRQLGSFFNSFQQGLNNISNKTWNRLSNMNFGNFGKGFFSMASKGFQMVDKFANTFLKTLFGIKSILGGGLFAAITGIFTHKLMHTARELETVYAQLLTVFGSQKRVREHFTHAREFVAKNRLFDLEQIHHGVTQLALVGMAKTAEQTDRNLKYIGDFAAGKNMDIGSAIQAVSQAANGNFQMLSYRGIRRDTLMQNAMNAAGDFTDEDGVTKKRSVEMTKLANVMAKAKVGTTEYTDALVRFLGIMESGGMAKMSQTIGGNIKAMANMFTIFKLEIVGASQEAGTFANAVAKTFTEITDKFQGKIHAIERIGAGIGNVFRILWTSADRLLGVASDKVVGIIDNLDRWFGDFKNNVAPFIVFITLIKIKVMDFFRGFKNGFLDIFKGFWDKFKPVLTFFGKLFGLFDKDAVLNTKKIGDTLGKITASLLLFKGIKTAASPILGGLGSIIHAGMQLKRGGAGGMFEEMFLPPDVQKVYVINMPSGGFGGMNPFGGGNSPLGLPPASGGLSNYGKFGRLLGNLFRWGSTAYSALGGSTVAIPLAATAGYIKAEDYVQKNLGGTTGTGGTDWKNGIRNFFSTPTNGYNRNPMLDFSVQNKGGMGDAQFSSFIERKKAAENDFSGKNPYLDLYGGYSEHDNSLQKPTYFKNEAQILGNKYSGSKKVDINAVTININGSKLSRTELTDALLDVFESNKIFTGN